ncbi:hypothetical protein AXG93_392s1610 [Marchantia polymorpha subsp. ruderalis]|uniref:DNA-directed primase/polymerase protein n=1 Tax=Marchantia polymorpha subsp. ruderalis TaxID=1480154 RepID=A0A176WSQ7_MARPO|nr:hypothetical protein AXG93_392s1610 [Marchantia polymorpha subsp. ruderalis]
MRKIVLHHLIPESVKARVFAFFSVLGTYPDDLMPHSCEKGPQEERDIFMDSLICRIGDECDRLLTFGLENAGHGGTVNYASWKEFATAPPKRPGFCMSGKSPFPALDIFVESVACIGNTQGKIRSWYWFSDYGVIVYNISENRFLMYIVDFRTAGYYQKCHDPDCRGYRSPLRPIPGHTIPSEYAPSSLTACTTYGEKAVNGRDQIKLFEDDSEDETWWEEVASSLDSMECNTSQSQSTSQVVEIFQISTLDPKSSLAEGYDLRQASLHQVEVDVAGDDEWWTSAEPELAALEKCILTQRK